MKDFLLNTAKLLLLAVLAVMLWKIAGGAQSQTSFEEVKKSVEASMGTEELKQADAQLLRRLYGLNSGELKNWTLWTASDNMAVEELLLVECTSQEQLAQIKEAAGKRADVQHDNFAGYAPEQVKMIDSAAVCAEYPYLLFSVSDHAEKVKQDFLKSLYPQHSGG